MKAFKECRYYHDCCLELVCCREDDDFSIHQLAVRLAFICLSFVLLKQDRNYWDDMKHQNNVGHLIKFLVGIDPCQH
jgi:hypothetical protein